MNCRRRDLVAGYFDYGEGGVVDYGGELGRFYVGGHGEFARIVIRHGQKGQ